MIGCFEVPIAHCPIPDTRYPGNLSKIVSTLTPAVDNASLHQHFEKLYSMYNRKEFIHPDPLEFVHRYDDPADQEVAGLIASGLAYGRVAQILQSLEKVFEALKRPAEDIKVMDRKELLETFRPFRHRWTTGEELALLLKGAADLRGKYGSLENCFLEGTGSDDKDVIPALTSFVAKLRFATGRKDLSLLACPSMGSACKRMFLFLRWMARRDEVDPGPWTQVPAAQLVVPMDVHMHRVSCQLGLTSRRQADLKSALQVTGFFKKLVPGDPVKYDFSLTRPGILLKQEIPECSDLFQAEKVQLC
jgi:uncharacterized protein (TIGR02757 family)